MESLATLAQAFMLLATASVAVFTVRATRRKTTAEAKKEEVTAADLVTAAALKLLEPLQHRIESLEAEVKRLREEIGQYRRDEAAYQAELHQKDVHIEELRMKLFEARDERDELKERVAHLEDVCKRAGINGEE